MIDFPDFTLSTLIAGFIFGVIGVYIIKKARADANWPNFIIGIALLVYPYFVSNIYAVWALGMALLAVAYRLRNW